MICPKCKSEYADGLTECSDCGVDLIPVSGIKTIPGRIDRRGISMVKYGIGLLFFAIFQLFAVIVAYEFLLVYKQTHGGVGGTVIENIHPLIWFLWLLEICVSLAIIIWGANIKSPKNNSKIERD